MRRRAGLASLPGDTYGEHRDGAPFDGHGIGRAWPLLVGERAHYELACGRRERAEALLHAMERFASPTGMLPEQVWDAPDRGGLRQGQPTYSAAPLGWSHTEYVKLCRSLADGRVFDLPAVVVRRSPIGTAKITAAGSSGPDSFGVHALGGIELHTRHVRVFLQGAIAPGEDVVSLGLRAAP